MTAWPQERADTLGQRLALRARQSVLAHRDYHTVRREDLNWTAVAAGVSEALLHARPQARATLVRLQAGAQLPWPDGVSAQEVLVVEGQLLAKAEAGAPVTLERHALVLRSAFEAGSLTACGDQATTLYVRQLLQPPATLADPEHAWWSLPRSPLQISHAQGRRWRPSFPGVEVLPLWGTADITSMLVRFAAGASVPDHPHAADEDCLMLEGEMFLGDILLRPGDYQLAPAGGMHFGETSDVGGTFFFHGAIDPVLVAPVVG
jgi:quercetin dioxygenase-like cupin family protein